MLSYPQPTFGSLRFSALHIYCLVLPLAMFHYVYANQDLSHVLLSVTSCFSYYVVTNCVIERDFGKQMNVQG